MTATSLVEDVLTAVDYHIVKRKIIRCLDCTNMENAMPYF